MEIDGNALIKWATFGIAVIGAALGVLNTWRDWQRTRPRLRVGMHMANSLVGDGPPFLTIDITNLSPFAVTVTHVGFFTFHGSEHMQCFLPRLASGNTLPVRLESRTSETIFQEVSALKPEQWLAVRCAYVNTACGVTAVGGHRFFKSYGATIAAEQL